MEQKQWNPLADIASILGSIAQLLPPLPTPLSSPVSEPRAAATGMGSTYSDVRDIVSTRQMKEEQKRQAEQGLVVFTYE